MNKYLRYLSLLFLITFGILIVITRGQWIAWLAPSVEIIEAKANLIQAIDSFINIVLVVLNFIFIYFTWLHPKPDETEKAPLSQEPLVQIRYENLLEQLGQYGGKVPYIERNITSISSLRGHGRIVISGQMKIGKSREAIELINKAILNDLVPYSRIFALSPSFKFFTPEILSDVVDRSVNTQEPILIFIDDFPRFFFQDGLRLIETLVSVLSKSKDFYLILTARADDITKQHDEWFKVNSIAYFNLPPFSPEQMFNFIDGASRALGITVENEAREILLRQSFGYPEYILIGFRKMLADGTTHINESIALQVSYQSLLDGWLSTKRYIEERKPAAKYILRSLGFFRTSLVTPYPNMVLAFAYHIWKNEKKLKLPISPFKRLKEAINYLGKFDFGIQAGILLFPDIGVEEDVKSEYARDTLGEFLVNYKSNIRNKFLQVFNHSVNEQAQCLLDLAYFAQNRFELDKAIKFYTALLQISPSAIAYLNRGSAFGESGQVSNALADFHEAEMLLINDPLQAVVFYNRSLAYIEGENYESALRDIALGLSITPNYPSLYRNRGIVYSKERKFEQALKDFDVAINGTSIIFEKAITYFARGNTFKEMGDIKEALKDYNRAIQLLPDNPRKAELYKARGILHEGSGKNNIAIEDYNRAINLNPKNASAYFSRGYLYFFQGKFDEALIDFDYATQYDTKLAMAYFGKSQTLSELGNLSEALAEINKALIVFETDQSKAMGLVFRGDIYSKSGDTDKAIRDYTEAINMVPDYSHAYFKRAKIFEKLGEFKQVIADCSKAMDHEKDSENLLLLLNTRGSAYDELVEYDLAINDLEKALAIDKENALTHFNIGITLSKQMDPGKALSSLTKALSINTRLWEAYANRGRIYSEIGNHKKALRDHNLAIQNIVYGPAKAGVYHNRGNTLMFLDKYLDAINDFTNAINLFDNNLLIANAYYRRSICYQLLDQKDKALEDLNSAITLNPDDPFSHLFRGGLLGQDQLSNDAISDFDKAIANAPTKETEVEAYHLRGIQYSKSGNYLQAIVDFNKTISLDPEDPKHYFNRGTNYIMIGDHDRALNDFNQCLELNSEYAEAYDNRGLVYASLGQHEIALEDLNKAIIYFGNRKERVTSFRKKALSLAYIGRLEEANICFQVAETIAPNDELTIATKIQLEYIAGKFDEALELIQKAEKMFTSTVDYGFYKTLILFRLNKDTDAIKSLRNYLRSKPLPANFTFMQSELKEISESENPPSKIQTAIKILDEYIRSVTSRQ